MLTLVTLYTHKNENELPCIGRLVLTMGIHLGRLEARCTHSFGLREASIQTDACRSRRLAWFRCKPIVKTKHLDAGKMVVTMHTSLFWRTRIRTDACRWRSMQSQGIYKSCHAFDDSIAIDVSIIWTTEMRLGHQIVSLYITPVLIFYIFLHFTMP